MGKTAIAWTRGDDGSMGKSWNPTRGCRRVSPGCGGAAGVGGCYAERQAYRFSGPGMPYEGLVTLGKNGPRWTGKGRLVPEMLAAPLSWRKPTRVFVDSMSDLFFEAFTNEEIAAVFGVMAAAPHHVFQVLTKRAERMKAWFDWHAEQTAADGEPWIPILRALGEVLPERLAWLNEGGRARAGVPELEPWPLPNVWLGVSIEDQQRADERIPWLLATPAAIRFLSVEPQIEAIDLSEWIERTDHCCACGAETSGAFQERCPNCGEDSLISTWGTSQAERYRNGARYEDGGPSRDEDGPQLHWCIQGGESGPNARPFDLRWARTMRDQCAQAGIAYFLKQVGAHPTDEDAGVWSVPKDRAGADPREWPASLQVQQFPRGAS